MEIKPYQIDELITAHGGDTTLVGLKAAVVVDKTHTCPQCSGAGRIEVPTGLAPGDVSLQECPTCDGYGKTTVQYYAHPTGFTYDTTAPEEG